MGAPNLNRRTDGRRDIETFRTDSADETLRLGEALADRLGAGDCVALVGELGAGKTVLVRGIARGLGVPDTRVVSSPSYVLVQEYAGRVPIYHVDLYRLGAAEADPAELGLDEMLADGVVLIEWADRAAGRLPAPRWDLHIEIAAAETRRFTLRRANPPAAGQSA